MATSNKLLFPVEISCPHCYQPSEIFLLDVSVTVSDHDIHRKNIDEKSVVVLCDECDNEINIIAELDINISKNE